MRPSVRLLVVASLLFIAAVVVVLVGEGEGVLMLGSIGVLFCSLLDALSFFLMGEVVFRRDLPARFALKSSTSVPYFLKNLGRLPLRVRFFEGLPEDCAYESLPFDLPKLKSKQHLSASYRVTFLKRGDLSIAPGYLEVCSLFGLWWRSRRVGEEEVVKVYPNYVPALTYGLLATADRAELMGIVKPRNKGMSKEFHQLRDYQDGDAVAQIDWKATSRFNRLITREYQEERDQTILLVPDCSIRTRVMDGELPVLDHLLNAAILLSYIALGQGDKVGVLSFGGEERYLAPVKGAQGMSQILNHLYNYQPTRSYGEYEELVTRIMRSQTKRCLVVVLTNLRTEDQFGSLGALQLLTRQHLVMLASVRETTVDAALERELEEGKDVNGFLGALAYEQDIAKLISEARGLGLSAVRESLEDFPVALANQFLSLRGSGRF